MLSFGTGAESVADGVLLIGVSGRVFLALGVRALDFLEEAEEDGMLVLEATQGSQFKTRLLGGWWVSAETLPKKAVVELEETSRGRRVRAVIEETMGFGWLDPVLADKYGSYFDSWLDGLEDVLEPYLACGKPPQARHRGKDERTRRYDRE